MDGDPRLAALVQFLHELDNLRTRVAEVEYMAVQLARTYGATWERIGDEFGISRQAARARFGKPRPRRRGRF